MDTLRWGEITASWIDYDTRMPARASFYGLEAFVVAHEIDHLDGILITDRVPVEKTKTGRNDPCPMCAKNGIKIKYKKCKEHFNG